MTESGKLSIWADNTQGVLVAILLTMLKMVGVITWPWWVVLLPFYGPYVIGLVMVITFGVYLWWVRP